MIFGQARGLCAAGLAVLALAPGFLASGAAQSPPARANEPITVDLGRPDIWDLLPLGRPFTDLATEGLVNLACGTAGGPPSLPLAGWWDYGKCPPDDGTGLHVIAARAQRANFEGADLDDAILYQTAFTGAVFIDAKMNRVDLRSSNLQNADFTNADLAGSAFWGVSVAGINLAGANLEGVTDLPQSALPAP